MKIGTLNRRIRIEQQETADDALYGPQPAAWSKVVELWANVQEMLPSRGERVAEGIRIAERPARVRTRYVDGITSDMRVVYLDRGNRVMKIITPPVELGNRDGLEFMVADSTPSGEGA